MIEAFFLDDRSPRLFVTYHPTGGGAGNQAAVICAPFFGEYMRVQLALRELSVALASAGQHVFRFDYRATGDSYGESSEVSLTAWGEDLSRVVREARELTGCDQVNLICVRGAAMVALSALGDIGAIGKIVFWDPIWNGAAYLDGLLERKRESNNRNRWLDRESRQDDPLDIFGNPVTEQFNREMRQITADDFERFAEHSCVAIATKANAFPDDSPLETINIAYDCNWASHDDAILMPQMILEEIASCTLSP